eukprot:gene5216-8817_t
MSPSNGIAASITSTICVMTKWTEMIGPVSKEHYFDNIQFANYPDDLNALLPFETDYSKTSHININTQALPSTEPTEVNNSDDDAIAVVDAGGRTDLTTALFQVHASCRLGVVSYWIEEYSSSITLKMISSTVLIIAAFLIQAAASLGYPNIKFTFDIPFHNRMINYTWSSFCDPGHILNNSCAYCTDSGFQAVGVLHDSLTKAYGYVGYQLNEGWIILSFRGSSNIENWLADFDILK